VLVSAVTLSLLRQFDEAKVLLLFDFFNQQDDQVWQRALAGLVTVLNMYDRRISFYPAVTEKLYALEGNKDLERNIQDLIIQFIKSKETEKITKKFQEEIVPEMIKLRPRLEDKLDLENLISESDMEDKNPDWETFFKDSPDLLSKLEEFSQLQIEGSDVFMSAFSMLKQFSFFDELINWFMPFHKDNQEVEQYFQNMKEDFDTSSFLDGLQKTAYLCNSDKYSFCLNVNRMPAVQRDAMLDMFKMEMQAMQEISKEEEILDKPVKDKMVFTQYLQDLYRFFKIHPLKNEFFDIFNMRFDLHNTHFFNILVKDPAIIRNIAEFYFSRDYYEEALEIFSEIMEDNEDYELLQKTGYCYQQLEQYGKAIEYYKKAEYFEKNKSWVLKKIAFCYRKLKQYQEALEYFKQLEALEPENLYIQTMLGRTNLDLNDYETALKYYFKVEYLQPDNHKVRRPIGWCSFLLGRFENARKYFLRIPEKAINEYDYLNLGHVEWCLGNKKSAIGYYRKALAISGRFDWLAAEFDNDSKHLIKFGINKLDLPLMLDFLRFDAENNKQ
jgi:tetratricopeptide (TPR) repeat protein